MEFSTWEKRYMVRFAHRSSIVAPIKSKVVNQLASHGIIYPSGFVSGRYAFWAFTPFGKKQAIELFMLSANPQKEESYE